MQYKCHLFIIKMIFVLHNAFSYDRMIYKKYLTENFVFLINHKIYYFMI